MRCVCVCLAAASAFIVPMSTDLNAANIVVNGDFELGNPEPGDTPLGYTQSGNPQSTGISIGAAESGNTAYDFGGSLSGGLGFVSQALPTSIGQAYQLSYYLSIPGDGPSNPFSPTEFVVNVGGDASSGTLVGGTTLADLVNPPSPSSSFGYTLMTATFMATSTTTNLNFGAFNNPSFFLLDNIAVAAVPEPSSMVLCGLGAVGLFVVARRRWLTA